MKKDPSPSKFVNRITWREHARLIWAITVKDLLDVVKNKSTISVLISALFILGMYRILPTLTSRMEPPGVLVYDAGDSALVAFLENSRTINVWTGYESEEHMKSKLADGDIPELGLVIPADFDQSLEAGNEVRLQGYVMHWVSPETAATLRRTFEDEIAAQLGVRVPIDLTGNVVYMQPDSSGPGMQAAAAAVFLVTMIGLSLISNLILEEKQSRTLDALLVSPASEGHVVAGKALAGLFYCLVGGVLALVVNANLVMHWWLAILMLVCFSLFAISLGLMLGTVIENRGQLTLWAWVVIIPMFLPVMIVMAKGLFPDTVFQVARWVPSAVFFNVWRYAFAQTISIGSPLLWSLYILIWAGLGLLLVVWLVRRHDRETQPILGFSGKALRGLSPRRLFAPLLAGTSRTNRGEVRPPTQSMETAAIGASAGTGRSTSARGLRIISAIAAKDMREALKNKLLLSILLGTAFVVVNGAILPLLLEKRGQPNIVVYDQGRSTLLRGMTGDESYRLVLVDTQEEFEDVLTEGPGTWLGLVIPEDFDQRAGDSQVIELEGFYAHWVDTGEIDEWKVFFEEQLGLATWGNVQIDLADHALYPAVDAGGQVNINLMTQILAISTIGIALVPLLMVEEKESHTLDALLVSPARLFQVIAGKALVGLVYCMLAAAVVIFFNRHRIVHWDIVLLTSILAGVFVVAVGVLVGVLSDNPTSAAFWVGPLLILLLVPLFAQLFITDSWSPLLRTLISWMPSSILLDMYRYSFASAYPVARLWSGVTVLASLVGAIFLLAGWRMQRVYR